MKQRPSTAAVPLLLAALAAFAGDAASAQPVVFTDERAFLAALPALGGGTITEGFEGPEWDGVRTSATGSAHTAGAVTSHGVTWTALHAVTTGDSAGSHGWAIFDHVGGDPDGLAATSQNLLYAVGGWFWTNTPVTDLTILVDGVRVNGATVGIDTVGRFLGVIAPAGFTRFEIRDLESSPLDIRHWFADDFTFSVGAPAPHATSGVVPGVANTHGLAGSDWHADLVVHNAGIAAALVELDFAPRGASFEPAAARRIVVKPNETRTFPDVVATLFAREASGALYWLVLAGDESAVLVSAAAYNRSPDGGRYGTDVPGVRWTDVAPPGVSQSTLALAGQFRTNLAIATDAACTGAKVRIFNRRGTLRAAETFAIPPASYLQLDDLFVRPFPGLLPDPAGAGLLDGLHRVEVEGIGGQLVAATSIVDNGTNDPTTFLATTPGARALWLPTAAATPGLNGSQWSSDLFLVNPGDVDTDVVLELNTSEGAGASEPVLVSLPAGQATALADVVRSAFTTAAPTSGSIHVVSSQPLLAWMRTSTPAGGGPAGGATFGQGTGAVPDGAALDVGGEARIAGFSHGPSRRSNLILQNTRLDATGAPAATTVVVDVLLADGTLTASSSYSLSPGEYRQHNRFIQSYGLPEISGATLRLRLADDGTPSSGGLVALVTEVEGNTLPGTNDSRTIAAHLVQTTAH